MPDDQDRTDQTRTDGSLTEEENHTESPEGKAQKKDQPPRDFDPDATVDPGVFDPDATQDPREF